MHLREQNVELSSTVYPSRVAIIYTGGTIGMIKNDQGAYIPNEKLITETIINNPIFSHAKLPQCDVFLRTPIDSSDMTPEHWYEMAGAILDIYKKYSGFVILHGTDTMAFSASALSFILVNLKKPVILTGSQLPLCEPYSDGYFNIIGAIQATTLGINEVAVYFAGKLMRGSRTQKYSAWALEAFDSATLQNLMTQGIDQKMNRYLISQYRPVWPDPDRDDFYVVKPSTRIGMLVLYPGFDPILFDSYKTYQGVVIKAFGTGNGPSSPLFLQKLSELHQTTAIVIVTQTHTGNVNLTAYQAASPLRMAGCISGFCMTPEAAFAKLSYLFGLGLKQKEVEEQFAVPLRGEFDV